MKAICVRSAEPGRPLAWSDVPDPVPGPDEVLVEVFATSLNHADLAQREGNYPPPPGASEILGLDAAGRIASAGPNVKEWQPGDRVCALLGGGGYAEYAAVPQDMLMRVPEGWTFEQAAALPEAFLTAFVNIFTEAAFEPGEVVLVHGGASGVGTSAIQLVCQAGGHVLATAGTEEKVAVCRALGAELAVNYRERDFAAEVRDHTAGAGVDIILDMVGASYLERNIGLLKLKGRLVFIATQSGAQATMDIGALMGRRLRLIGSMLRARKPAEKAGITRGFVDRFGQALAAGAVRPVIDSVYPIERAEEAHRRMASGAHTGKIVLKVR
jgi:putative PIG3 family NAD(P)H quinone oxidoreductase